MNKETIKVLDEYDYICNECPMKKKIEKNKKILEERKSELDKFIKSKDDEMRRIKGMLGALKKDLDLINIKFRGGYI